MINIRYHIVSITAVFLAIGIGVAMGSALVERGAVVDLERRVDGQDGVIIAARAEAETVRRQLAEQDGVADAATGRLFRGRIEEQPLLVLRAAGVNEDEDVADQVDLDPVVLETGAAFAGHLIFTERLALADDDERLALAEALGVANLDAEALRNELGIQLARVFDAAAESDEPSNAGVVTTTTTTSTTTTTTTPTTSSTATTTTPSTTTTTPEPDVSSTTEVADSSTSTSTSTTTTTQPTTTTMSPEEVEANRLQAELVDRERRRKSAVDLLGRLIDADFVRYEPSAAWDIFANVDAEKHSDVLTPASGSRFLLVNDENAVLSPDQFALPLIESWVGLVEGGDEVERIDVAEVVIVEDHPPLVPDVEETEGEGGDEEDDGSGERTSGDWSVVDLVRSDTKLVDKVSTVDSVGRFSGQVAAVLALEDLPGEVGHYGFAAGASAAAPD